MLIATVLSITRTGTAPNVMGRGGLTSNLEIRLRAEPPSAGLCASKPFGVRSGGMRIFRDENSGIENHLRHLCP